MSMEYCMRQPSCHACKGKCAAYKLYQKMQVGDDKCKYIPKNKKKNNR